jgi:hypothetical protein
MLKRPCDTHCLSKLQASLHDGFLGVGTPSIASIKLLAAQPIVTFEDSPNTLSK